MESRETFISNEQKKSLLKNDKMAKYGNASLSATGVVLGTISETKATPVIIEAVSVQVPASVIKEGAKSSAMYLNSSLFKENQEELSSGRVR